MFEPGTLWSKTVETTEKALKTGALQPISTECTFLYDSGIEFLVRIVSNLTRKTEERKESNSSNPFLPYEKDMFVMDISETHICLLNKFNVIDHHLLIVTRSFEDQENLLTIGDFNAIWSCMAEYDCLAFYNGGEIAGASQQHKHLQIIPLPMANKGPRVPIESLFQSVQLESNPGVIPGVPFIHSFTAFFPDFLKIPEGAAKTSFEL